MRFCLVSTWMASRAPVKLCVEAGCQPTETAAALTHQNSLLSAAYGLEARSFCGFLPGTCERRAGGPVRWGRPGRPRLSKRSARMPSVRPGTPSRQAGSAGSGNGVRSGSRARPAAARGAHGAAAAITESRNDSHNFCVRAPAPPTAPARPARARGAQRRREEPSAGPADSSSTERPRPDQVTFHPDALACPEAQGSCSLGNLPSSPASGCRLRKGPCPASGKKGRKAGARDAYKCLDLKFEIPPAGDSEHPSRYPKSHRRTDDQLPSSPRLLPCWCLPPWRGSHLRSAPSSQSRTRQQLAALTSRRARRRRARRTLRRGCRLPGAAATEPGCACRGCWGERGVRTCSGVRRRRKEKQKPRWQESEAGRNHCNLWIVLQ
ncbi:protein FAM90A20-like [Pongo abelii]|uniref:protein FAM90A20-like n=1 Tax=Pongo abelii TaxID=9601 RepID=UPI0023E84414|nr:putative protein FAM90A20P [Pongo abelii]